MKTKTYERFPCAALCLSKRRSHLEEDPASCKESILQNNGERYRVNLVLWPTCRTRIRPLILPQIPKRHMNSIYGLSGLAGLAALRARVVGGVSPSRAEGFIVSNEECKNLNFLRPSGFFAFRHTATLIWPGGGDLKPSGRKYRTLRLTKA